jgi:hypothetical protein
MKNIFLIPIFFVVTNVFSQKYDLNSHPLKSDVWETKYIDSVSDFKPKNYKGFSFDVSYVKSNIDPVKIQGYLHESLNRFRSDYNLNSVIEDTLLTKSSIEYSKQLLVKFKHDENAGKLFSEAIVTIPFIMFSRITEKDVDINKIIADCCFDIFVGSPSHMSVLLNENPKRQFGFGITVTDVNIGVVVRSVIK